MKPNETPPTPQKEVNPNRKAPDYNRRYAFERAELAKVRADLHRAGIM